MEGKITKEDWEKIHSLTKEQAKFLSTIFNIKLKLMDSSEYKPMASGASGMAGPALGRTAGSLKQRGFIRPVGRENRQFRWKLTHEWEEKVEEEGKTLQDAVLEILEE